MRPASEHRSPSSRDHGGLVFKLVRLHAAAVDLAGVCHLATTVTSGAGPDAQRALTASLAEGVERGTALCWDARNLDWASSDELEDERASFLDEQAITRQSGYLPGLARVGSATRRPWLRARVVTCAPAEAGAVLVPASTVLLGVERVKELPRQHVNNSNGLAAHRTPEGALVGALLELIERDAVLCWWWGLIEGVRLAGPLEARMRLEARRACRADAHLVVLRTETGTPVVVCALVSSGGELVIGSAARSCAQDAAWSAYYEAACRLEILARSPQGPVRAAARGGLADRLRHHLRAPDTRRRFVTLPAEASLHERCECRDHARDRGHLGELKHHLTEAGISTLAVSLRSDGWHVVRAISPDLLPLNTATVEQPRCAARVRRLRDAGLGRALVAASDPAQPHPIS